MVKAPFFVASELGRHGGLVYVVCFRCPISAGKWIASGYQQVGDWFNRETRLQALIELMDDIKRANGGSIQRGLTESGSVFELQAPPNIIPPECYVHREEAMDQYNRTMVMPDAIAV